MRACVEWVTALINRKRHTLKGGFLTLICNRRQGSMGGTCTRLVIETSWVQIPPLASLGSQASSTGLVYTSAVSNSKILGLY